MTLDSAFSSQVETRRRKNAQQNSNFIEWQGG